MAKAVAKTKMVETPANGRTARVARETKETAITADLNLDGEGRFTGAVGVPFFEHMMALFTRHALVDLELSGTGDTQVDAHHTVEDCGIVLGQAIRRAAGDKRGIARYGMAYVPMEETLARCVLDLCDRPFLRFDAELPKAKIGDSTPNWGRNFCVRWPSTPGSRCTSPSSTVPTCTTSLRRCSRPWGWRLARRWRPTRACAACSRPRECFECGMRLSECGMSCADCGRLLWPHQPRGILRHGPPSI